MPNGEWLENAVSAGNERERRERWNVERHNAEIVLTFETAG